MSSSVEYEKDKAIAKVEELFESIVESLSKKKPICISLKIKQKLQIQTGSAKPTFTIQSYSFPGADPEEAWMFSMKFQLRSWSWVNFESWRINQTAVLFRILGLIHEALTSGVIVSKRYVHTTALTLLNLKLLISTAATSTTKTPRSSNPKPLSTNTSISSLILLAWIEQPWTSWVLTPLFPSPT